MGGENRLNKGDAVAISPRFSHVADANSLTTTEILPPGSRHSRRRRESLQPRPRCAIVRSTRSVDRIIGCTLSPQPLDDSKQLLRDHWAPPRVHGVRLKSAVSYDIRPILVVKETRAISEVALQDAGSPVPKA